MIKVHLDQRHGMDAYDVYIMQHGFNYNAYMKITAKGTEWVEYQPTSAVKDEVKPTLTLQTDIALELAKTFNTLGIKPESEHKLQGVLEATQTHLEDMRTIALNKYNHKNQLSRSGE